MRFRQNIPTPPEKPTPYECCGSGCMPCIYDYYYDQLTKWEHTNGCSLEEYLKDQPDQMTKPKDKN